MADDQVQNESVWPRALLDAWGVNVGADTEESRRLEAVLADRLRLPLAVARHLVAVYSPLVASLAGRLPQSPRPPVLGINGAQGTGKSTAAEVIAELLGERGFRVCCLSIDDLYLTRAERAVLAETVHPLLQTRGVPGTHDLPLGLSLIHRLRAAGPDSEVAIPRFDKARDERRPEAQWELWRGRPDLVIFEGWCLGARPEPESVLAEPVNALEQFEDPEGRWRRYANTQLQAYQPLFAQLDYLVMLKAPSFEQVYQWRSEQEVALAQRLAEKGDKTGKIMSDEQLQRFIQHYERLTRWILREMPTRADLLLRLDADHRVERVETPSSGEASADPAAGNNLGSVRARPDENQNGAGL